MFFKFNRDTSLEQLNKLHYVIVSKLQSILEEYKIDSENIINLQLIFRPFSYRFLSDIKLHENMNYKGLPITIKKDIELFPISNEENLLGLNLIQIIMILKRLRTFQKFLFLLILIIKV